MECKKTYCCICEQNCGLVATVEGGTITRLRPDADHPISQGFACPKGIAMTDIAYDPDRVLQPLRRRAGTPPGPGSPDDFEPVTWDEAMTDIAGRLRAISGDSVGVYLGNPLLFSYTVPPVAQGFVAGLGSKHYYSVSSQDTSTRLAASALLYGSASLVPLPDLYRTDFLFMVGANPFVSHGSMFTAKRVRKTLHGIVERGGRIVVVDPRRTETAQAFEHLPVRPDADAWLLLSMLHVILGEGLEDTQAVAEQARGIERLRELVSEHPPERTASLTGIGADTVRQLARDLAAARSASFYGRLGSNRGRSGTLCAFLLDALNVVTGNLDRPGGAIIGGSTIPAAFTRAVDSFGKLRTRVGDFPDTFGMMCAGVMAKEILTPGEGQLRALFVLAGNPVLSLPNSAEMEAALPQLDLLVSLDLYMSETAAYADYILPATTFLERENAPLINQPWHLTPFIEWVDAVIAPRGESREESEVLSELARRIGVVPASVAPLRCLGRLGIRPSPRTLMDLAIRLGRRGDWLGLRRGGISADMLMRRQHGLVLAEHHPTGVLRKYVRHSDKRVHLDPPQIAGEVRRLGQREQLDPDFPLSMITLRELRSQNSWMHNAPSLMAGDRVQRARMSPVDAAAAGVEDGDLIEIRSATGAIELPVRVTDEMRPGAIAVPHGWGHHRTTGWRLARSNPGANVNALTSSALSDIEQLSGMAHLDGVPVRIRRVA